MANITVRIDDELKQQAEELFHDLGMTLSTAVTTFLRQSIREQALPFQLRREIPNAVTLAAMAEAEDMEANPDKYPVYNNIDDIMADLL